ncbi:MAG: Lrp/AsnC family transcriptional regulator, partial [Candidatus Bathyarchaeia archaeon]
MSSNLDLVDLRILEELKQNARVDAKSLAEKLGVSDRTVARRMKLMEEAGIVKRYTAIIDYDVLMRATNVATLPQKEVEPGHITVEMVELFGMMTTLKRIFGTGMGLILQYIGIGIGRGMASTLPKDMDAAARCILGVQKLNSEGWGFFTTKLDESGSVNAIVLSEGCF